MRHGLGAQRVRPARSGGSGGWRGLALVAALATATTTPGCSTAPDPPPAGSRTETEQGDPAADGFQASRAFGHLRGLVDIGPRVMGTEGAAAAQAYVRRHLAALGLEPEEQSADVELSESEPVTLVNLSALLPGSGADERAGEFVLATPIDTAPAETFQLDGANEGASGVALLLEAARVLSSDPLPYPVRLLFLDGELFEDGKSFGSALAWDDLARRPVRLLVYVHQLADADLAVHRDLLSHRIFRDTFFEAAERLGHGLAFPRSAPFDQVPGGHRFFFERGLRQIVALSDIRYGGADPPGTYWRTAEDDLDHVSEQSLGVAGVVVVAGLRDVAAHLVRVDAHVRRPPAPAEPEPVSEASETAQELPAGEAAKGSEDESADPEGPPEAPETASPTESEAASEAAAETE